MSDASRIVFAAAKEVLLPLGLVQRGRSRVWLDDHGWWLVVVEFQPSSWSRGTYLNVGAMWLWYPKDHLSFDHGYRANRFERLLDESSFEAIARRLAVHAAEEVRRLRSLFVDIRAVAQTLEPALAGGGWRRYDAAIAHALAGHTSVAKAALRDLSASEPTDAPWLRELRARAGDLAEACEHPAELSRLVHDFVDQTRAALHLPERPRGDWS